MATPKNTDLVKYFQNAVKEGWGYVWSLNGELYTQEKADHYHKIRRSTSKSRNPATYWTKDCKKWIGKMAADCSGGIVGAIRSINPGFSDRNANTFKKQFTESGKIDTIPEIPGLAIWRSGHIGIYEGNGYGLEFRGTDYGCVRTKVASRDWTHWGKIKGVEYPGEAANPAETVWKVNRLLKLTDPMQRGEDVKELQTRLNSNGCNCGKVDGVFGSKTDAAVRSYQKKKGLVVDGKAGKNTITALGGKYET